MNFYTYIKKRGDILYLRGYKDGERYEKEIKYEPYLFVSCNEDSEYKTIHGENVRRIDFSSINNAYNYVKKHENIVGHKIYGMQNYEYVYLYDNFKEGFDFDYSLIKVVEFDIETSRTRFSEHKIVKIKKEQEFYVTINEMRKYKDYEVYDEEKDEWINVKNSDYFRNPEESYGDPQKANKEITEITLTQKGKSITLGYFDYKNVNQDRIYFKCKDEKELLRKFIKILNSEEWSPDILTGYNSEFYDLPYIINRINLLLGEEWALKLSPFGFITEKEVTWKNGKNFKTYDIGGIVHLDYMVVYKKFSMGEKENYKLNTIAEIELGRKKLDYSEYKSLDQLYRNNFEKYTDYNILDSLLLGQLEEKLHYIEQMVSIAYVQRVNIQDALTTVKPWDVMIHNYLIDQNIVIPPLKVSDIEKTVVGGYVKEPVPGIYEWIVTVDFTSLYPSLAMQYNISPDTFVKKFSNVPSFQDIMFGDISKYTEQLKKKNFTMTPNGCLYRKDKRGFFPYLTKKFFDDRKIYKKKMIEAEKEYEKDPENKEKRNLYNKYNNMQNALKVCANGGYGALLNPFNRWFASYLGESITSSGQMTTMFIVEKINYYLNKKYDTKNIDYACYGDTDSVMLNMKECVIKSGLSNEKDILNFLIKEMEKDIIPFINNTCKELGDRLNVYELNTVVKLEKICPKALFKRKKRYILNVLYNEGVFYKEPKLKVTGMETVRSNTPLIPRKKLEECFNIIMNKDNEKLYKLVENFSKEFKKLKFNEIGKPSSVNDLKEYSDPKLIYKKGTPAQVRGSLIFNNLLVKYGLEGKIEPIYDSDKVKYCYLIPENPFHDTIISAKDDLPEEFEIEKYIDYDKQFEAVFYKPLKDLCKIIGWTTEEQYTLDDIF
jgi:DNA polymerase elongation subunit (family B)